MKKISPQHSRKEVNRAGEILQLERTNIADVKDYLNALKVLNNWRTSHNYPLNTFQANLRTKIKRAGIQNAIVAQRLKRIPSIVSKLSREKYMKLSTMQDIGGIRTILPTLGDVHQFAESFRKSKIKHELIKEYDYVTCPKESGYRSIHFVYRYNNHRAPEYNGLKVELQIRNQLQHSWATAVEIVGAFLNTSLKSSEGPDEWLAFFSMVGSAFALLENCQPHEDFEHYRPKMFREEIAETEKKLAVRKNLTTFGSTIRALDFKKMYYKYYLLHMKPEEKLVSYKGFHENQLEEANELYTNLEKKVKFDQNEQIVLVSGMTFMELQKAYPNYFLDSRDFLKNLNLLKKKLG